ncbi:hypothetical protein EES42_31410 [Streptomyces sp. ADI95-17]|nr:hypothetical protein EES42_31410 [Streptomyces sp. ADI95-17]
MITVGSLPQQIRNAPRQAVGVARIPVVPLVVVARAEGRLRRLDDQPCEASGGLDLAGGRCDVDSLVGHEYENQVVQDEVGPQVPRCLGSLSQFGDCFHRVLPACGDILHPRVGRQEGFGEAPIACVQLTDPLDHPAQATPRIRDGMVYAVALEAAVAQDLPGLHPGEGVLDAGADLAVGSVVFLFPGREFGLALVAAVRDDQTVALYPPSAITAVRPTAGFRTGQLPRLAVVAVAGAAADRPRRAGCRRR